MTTVNQNLCLIPLSHCKVVYSSNAHYVIVMLRTMVMVTDTWDVPLLLRPCYARRFTRRSLLNFRHHMR